MPDPTPLTILHLSDLQFGHKHRFGRLAQGDPDASFDTLLARLKTDLDELRDRHDLKPDLLVVSGDLAEWGKKAEFDDALTFLAAMADHLHLPRRRVVVVPGNHDVNRDLCESYFSDCRARDSEPVRPFWKKWEFFHALFQEFYRDEPDLAFSQDEPWTWYKLDDLHVVVAGLNSTMPEIHGDEAAHKAIQASSTPPRGAYEKLICDGTCGHFGRCGEKQLDSFARRLKPFVDAGWFRIGVLHHNMVRGPESDDENLRDVEDFKRLVAPSLNLVLHGHTHFGALQWLNQHLPAISTGSAGLRRDALPEDKETPNQYQIVQVFPDRFVRSTRCYDPADKHWIGDTRRPDGGDDWRTEEGVAFQKVDGKFPESKESAKRGAARSRKSDRDRDPEIEAREPDREHEQYGREVRRDDFLARVADVCRLREPEKPRVVEQRDDESGIPYLRVTCRDGLVTSHFPIGALEHGCSADDLQRFLQRIDRPFRAADPNLRSQLVYGGPPAAAEVEAAARKAGVQLMSFTEYEGLIDFRRYLTEQTGRLQRDPIYPPRLYVPQRYLHHVANQRQPGDNVTDQVYQWLEQPDSRFVLVLGEFGTGKTFLLHELARQMPERLPHLTPVLIEMRSLERGHPVDVLVSMHMIAAGEERFDIGRFRYMLRHGRICLLFDGFDELALRVTYDRAAEHLAALVDAAQGQAKVVVTSRTQHFLSEQQVKQFLYTRIETVPAQRLVELRSFEPDQVRSFFVNYYRSPAGHSPLPADDFEVQKLADQRMALIQDVQDLQGLAANPRLLSFIAELDDQPLREARDATGQITAADLYQIILDKWLDGEVRRRWFQGGLKTLGKDDLWAAVTRLALRMWETGQRSVDLGELTEQVQAALHDVRSLDMTAHEAAFEVGAGSLLIRDREGRFSFVHRSVMEWLLAREAAAAITADRAPQPLEQNEISPLMAEFLLGLAKPDRALDWAGKALHVSGGEEGWLKKNALLVVQRHQERHPVASPERPAPIDLSGQDLRGKDLTGQDLRGANLRGADLTEARLDGADLREAMLDGAIFARASLLGADLRGASVADAVFRRAKLIGAKLGVNLIEALGDDRCFGAALTAAPTLPADSGLSASFCHSVAVSPDGTLLASGHDDGSVRIWDVATAKELRACSGHSLPVYSVAFSPDGRQLASGSHDRSVRIWDVASAKELRACAGHSGSVSSVAFSPDGRQLASGSYDKSVRIWDVATAKELRACAGHSAHVTSVAFSPDGLQLASGSVDQSVRIWDVATAKELLACSGHSGPVFSVAFSPDGRQLASGSYDKSVRIWDVATAKELRACAGHTDYVRSVAFSPDGRQLASGSHDKSVRIWDVATAKELRACAGHSYSVTSVAFSPVGRQLATGSNDQSVRIWDVATAKELRACAGHTDYVRSVAFSPDGRQLASGSDDQSVRIWDVANAKELRACAGHSGFVNSVAFSPDGRQLASGSSDKSVRIWDVANAKELRACAGHSLPVYSVAFSPDGRQLASGSDDQSVRIWDVANAKELRACAGHSAPVTSVAFSPDGLQLASGSVDKSVRIWDVANAKELRACAGHSGYVLSVAFSPDGRQLAGSSSDQSVHIWDVASAKELRACSGHSGPVFSVAFSPDGRQLASGSDDKSVRIWDVATAKELRACAGHSGSVRSVAFSPDGRQLASGSYDGTVRIWSVATGECLATLLSLPEGGWAVVLPDGRYKLSGNAAGRFWWTIGLCRFEPGELDPYVPGIQQLPLDTPLFPAAS